MSRINVCLGLGILLCLAGPLAADNTYRVIIKGHVTMEDGSVPPFSVLIERICSDNDVGGQPGPLTNKKGEWVWNLEIDPTNTRSCFFRVSHAGWISNRLDAQALNVTSRATTLELPPLVISPKIPDPYLISITNDNIPAKAKSSIKAAMKALDDSNYREAATQLEAAVGTGRKFAEGWHALGIVDERLERPKQAREAYQHAIDDDPKMLTAYVTLTRLCLQTKDWDCAAKNADELLKLDKKQLYPEIYLHQAVARYEMKDLDGALSSVQESIKLDTTHKRPREEYVLGRILEAKGDINGAREHMSKYLQMDNKAGDLDAVRAHIENLGKAAANSSEPNLEYF